MFSMSFFSFLHIGVLGGWQRTFLTQVHVLLSLRQFPCWSFCKTVPDSDFPSDWSEIGASVYTIVFQIPFENCLRCFSPLHFFNAHAHYGTIGSLRYNQVFSVLTLYMLRLSVDDF